MGRTLRGSVLGGVLAVAVGCTESRTYSLSVRNDLDRPVTVCLTKTYGPAENGWESPEEAAGPDHPASDERPPGVVVRPGKTAREGPITGEFYRDRGRAVLRVYSGAPTLNQMNAVSRGDLDRLDVDLRPGANDLVVRRADGGGMEAVPASMAREPTDRPAGPGDPWGRGVNPDSYQQHRAAAAPIVAAVAVVTLSDSRTVDTDASGRRAIDLLIAGGHRVVDHRVLPDDPAALGPVLAELLGRADVDAIVTTGGTGVGRRDQTIGVVERRLDVPLPGFGELFRMLSWEQVGSGAMLSRAVGGIAAGKPVFSLPGSPAAVELGVSRLVVPELPHLLRELRK